MKVAAVISKLFVKPFYRENAVAFIFLITVMFCIVNRVDGAGLYEYHQVLVMGMLTNPVFLLLVFFLWFLYARKCFAFVSGSLAKPEFSFSVVLNRLGSRKRFVLFFGVHLLLLLPVLLYTIFIVFTAWQSHHYYHMVSIPAYLFLLAAIAAYLVIQQLKGTACQGLTLRILPTQLFPSNYIKLLLQFIVNRQKITLAAIKLFSCAVLYFYCRNTPLPDQDASFLFLLFNFGILAHGVLINRVRQYEETYLSFYRGMPVSLGFRMVEYAFVYLIFLMPESFTVFILAPTHLHVGDGIVFLLAGYSVLMLLNSICFFQHFDKRGYFKIIVVIFFVEYVLMITCGLSIMFITFLTLSVILFFRNYYRFEPGL